MCGHIEGTTMAKLRFPEYFFMSFVQMILIKLTDIWVKLVITVHVTFITV